MADQQLYPQLPELPTPDSFRLQQISEIKRFFESEIEFRRKIFSKYMKAFDATTAIDHFLNITSVVAGSLSVTALAGVITAPIGMALGGITIGGAVVSSILTWEKKNILKKLEKHEYIYTMAISKLNTVNDLVSKALNDSHISTEEFTLIIKEREKYIILKNEARKKHRESTSGVDVEALKKTFLEEGKKLAQSEMIEKLKKQ